MLTVLTGDQLMRAHENWCSCEHFAAGRVESWRGMGHADFAMLNASLPQELFLGERQCQGFSGVG
jgi:hypothetical protein